MANVILRSPRYPSDPFLERAENSATNAKQSEEAANNAVEKTSESEVKAGEYYQGTIQERSLAEVAKVRAVEAESNTLISERAASGSATIAEQNKQEAERAKQITEAVKAEVDKSIIPLHTDVIKTQASITKKAYGVSQNAEFVENSTNKAKEYCERAEAATTEAEQLKQIAELSSKKAKDSEEIASRSEKISKQAEERASNSEQASAMSAEASNSYQLQAQAEKADAESAKKKSEQAAEISTTERKKTETARDDSERFKIESEAAANESKSAVADALVPVATNLIRTQSIITQHHAFK